MKKIEFDREVIQFIIKVFVKISIVIMLIIGLSTVINGFFKTLDETKTFKYNIESVVSSKGAEGSFILGTGNINDEAYFLAYETQDDGGKVLRKYDSARVIIYENLENNKEPYVEKTEYQLTGELKECKLYFPRDTIKKEVDINLSNINN